MKASQPSPGLRENKKNRSSPLVRHNDGQWSFLKIDNNVNASATDCIVRAVCRPYETIKQVRSSFIALATFVQSSPDAICSTYLRMLCTCFHFLTRRYCMGKMDNKVLPLGKILSAWRTLYVARYEAYTARTFCRHGLSKVGLLKRHSIFPISSLVALLLRPNPQNLAMPRLLLCHF